MTVENYLMGSKIESWKETDVKNITFVVTEDCNLVCKYCYITGKNTKNKMSFETAKKAVDYILNNPDEFPESSVIWEFIGGEPFLEVGLMDQITDYIKTEMYRLNHKWFENYRISISTNGLLYHTPEVQRYIKKNLNNLSIGISVDGNKIKHDQQRVKPDGSGSYEEVVKNVPLWLEQFPNGATKATFASADLPYLKDSIISIYELGIKTIPANVIFEEGWEEGDDLVFEEQLRQLADYIIDNRLWDEFNCSLFSDSLGFPLTEENLKANWCGAGRMLSIDYEGNFYPCTRFVGYSLNNREGYVVGNIEDGYDHDKIRPFLALTLEKQSTEECINCQVAIGCAWCQGLNYDDARIDTIYERATYICKMHKARVRANDYYWARVREVAELDRDIPRPRKDHLYFLLSDESVRHCTYKPKEESDRKMSLETLKKGLEFARKNFYTPVLMLPPEGLSEEERDLLRGMDVLEMQSGTSKVTGRDAIVVYDNQVGDFQDGSNCILIIKADLIPNLSDIVKKIFMKQSRINLILEETEKLTNEELSIYENELLKIAEYLAEQLSSGRYLELNVLSDAIHLEKMANCNAGLDSFALAPDGKFYLCPAFYYTENGDAVGTVEEGINFNYREFLTGEKSSLCSACDAYHCRRCIYQNKMQTKEYLIPGKVQCVVSHIERKMSKEYATLLLEKRILRQLTPRSVDEIFPEIDYYDPLEKVVNR
ncbi:MAG: radical SAM peptide maturase, CXXX-repeat target family [Halanaerobiales bacterium]|nr:radical SAM peptide maturase, CXXX-repeat target family [Halanaerobiales bacterium]